MPTIAIVDGMAIRVYANDHPPPHIHVRSGDEEALVSIATGKILRGSLPKAKEAALKEWFLLRQEHIAYLWVEIQNHRYPRGLPL